MEPVDRSRPTPRATSPSTRMPRPGPLHRPRGVRRRHLQPHAAPRHSDHRAHRRRSTTLPSSPGEAKVSKHMLLFQPAADRWSSTKPSSVENTGKTTWYDPGCRHRRVLSPQGAGGNVEVEGTAPDGVPHGRSGSRRQDLEDPMSTPSKFAVKPGETRFDLSYTVPYTEGAPYAGKILTKDENTYLIAPNGVTLTGRPSERPGHRAAHPGPHLRPAGRQLQDPAHRHGAAPPAADTQRPGGEQRPAASSRSCPASTARPS